MKEHNCKRMRGTLTLFAGIVMGLALAGPAAHAAEAFLKAYPSTQTFYVDDRKVELEAYVINGSNYIKLRDIGQAVGFNVAYDPVHNYAIIQPDKPYTGENMVLPDPSPNSQADETTDYAANADPAIFTDVLTSDLYNGIRDTLLNREAILAGDRKPTAFRLPAGTCETVENAVIALGSYPLYELSAQGGGEYVCNVRCPEAYDAAAEHTQSFVDGLAGLSQRRQVEEIVWYVCDRITYEAWKYPSPGKVLSQDSAVQGCCMAYAHAVQFLCNRADIPCILIHSEDHQWNMIYVEGRWWSVDATALDVEDDPRFRPYLTVLEDPSGIQGRSYTDLEPAVTAFAQELLVPGSTK